MRRSKTLRFASPFIIGSAAIALAACSVEKTEEGELPDIDVSASRGNLPEYEVRKTRDGNLPDVDVDARGGNLPKYDVDGPDVRVERKEVEVPYPDVDIDMPDERSRS